MTKTNAMRILESHGVAYTAAEYPVKDGKIDGVSVAAKLGTPVERVFKTLVTQNKAGELFVFIIPVAQELDLKKAAKAAGQKSVEMIPQSKLLPATGYVHGGCSPFGMKKQYPTYLDESAILQEEIHVSGGKVGLQVRLAPEELIRVAKAEYFDLVRG